MREPLLVTTFVELTDVLVDDFDVIDLLAHLTDRCVEVLDVSAAGIMLVDPTGQLSVVASSSEAMRTLELFEIQSDEGPCVECLLSGQAIANVQLSALDHRWPRFATRSIAAGFVSVTAIPMRLRGSTIGALNLFRQDFGAINDLDLAAAQAFADVATIGILQHRAVQEAHTVNDQLTAALNSRVVIEQAKGMVAERTGLAMEESFNQLRRYARHHNLLLSDLARQVIDGTVAPNALATKRPRPARRP